MTGRSVLDVVQSGEAALPALVSFAAQLVDRHPAAPPAVQGCGLRSVARVLPGGRHVPCGVLGAVIGVLVAPLPGLGTTAGIAIGMTAATTAVLRLPVTSVILVVLLLGSEGASQIPIVMVAAAVRWSLPSRSTAD